MKHRPTWSKLRTHIFYIQRIWYSWWNPLNCIRTYMPMTPRSTVSVDPGKRPQHYQSIW